jgi:NADH:ubiquinone oxidoreductase subunit 3 (subunit A)
MLPICTHYLHVCTLINKIVITTKRNPIKAYIYKSPEESFETQDSKVEIQFLNLVWRLALRRLAVDLSKYIEILPL